MKIHNVIWFLLSAAMVASCSPHPRKSERMAAALKQAEAVYGDGSLLIETDTALFIPGLAEAAEYYAGRKQYNKAALAALYNGYAEKDYDKELSMVSFKEAVLYGELVQDSLIVGRAKYQLGKMLYDDCMYDLSLDMLKDAIVLFEHQSDEKMLTMSMTACCFMLLNDYDNATLYLEHCLRDFDVAHSSKAKGKVLNNYAVLHRLKGENNKAIEYLRLIEPQNKAQELLNCLNLAEVFYMEGAFDSAGYYFNILEQKLDKTNIKGESKCSAYEGLSIFAEHQNRLKEAISFRKAYEEYLIDIMDDRNQKRTFRIQQKYDYEALQKAMNQKITDKQRFIVITCLLLVMLAIALTLTQRKLANKTKQEAQTRKLMAQYIQQYYDLLTKQGETMKKAAIVMEYKKDRMLLNDLIKTIFGEKDPWEAMCEVFKSLHPEACKTMETLASDLTELEQKDLLLSFFDVSRQDEAFLLKTSIHSVDKLRQSVKKKAPIRPNY